MEQINQKDIIDIRLVFNKIWNKKELFYKTLPIAFVLSCFLILCVPRYYTTEVKLAPETENSGASGAISSLASSFGFDLSEMQTSDAITPLLYPDLMEDNAFVTSMFNIKVKDQEGEINTTYHDYLKNYQRKAWWTHILNWLKRLIPKSANKEGSDEKFNPYYLSREEDNIANSIRGNIDIAIDKKTGVITINTKAQDALICKTLGDSVKERLQKFITAYRTSKARIDYEYYKKLTEEAKEDYEKARQRYAATADASTNISLRSIELKLEDLENDMQLKFNSYTSMNTQLQASKAKVQERTPAFTLLKGASVPVKPSGPKRMIFVIAMMLLTFIGTSLYAYYKPDK